MRLTLKTALAARSPGRELRAGRATSLQALFMLLVAVSTSGCYYGFSGSNIPSHIKTIAVANVENGTLQAGLDQVTTEVLTAGFLKDGRLKIATLSNADARLDAKITSYENKVNNYSPEQQPVDYIVVMKLQIHMHDQVKNRDLWSEDNLTATEIWVPGTTTELDAREIVLLELTDDIVTRTLEQW